MSVDLGGEHAALGRESLARLVLSDEAVRVADYATGLVSTRNDGDTGKGGRASQAAQLVAMADTVLLAAVVYERERGSTWAEIGSYLGVAPVDAEQRFADSVAAWDRALAEAARDPATPGVPLVLRDPIWTGKYLDSWAHRHIVLTKDRHEVTGRMLGLPAPGEPGWSTPDVAEHDSVSIRRGSVDRVLRWARAAARRVLGRRA